MPDHAINVGVVHGHIGVDALGGPASWKKLFGSERGLRTIFRMLHQHRTAGDQLRPGNPSRLVEGKVPRLDRLHHTPNGAFTTVEAP
ncbi:MAG TPA: hypothetical protein VIT65_17360 [Microlunatus sp.]